ncbi:MAG: DNA-binding protein [bacterium]|nr:DNA-binding protein [bacterium]
MQSFALRLHPNQDLKQELIHFTKENNIKAGAILTCVGSLKKAIIRTANEKRILSLEQNFEIVSLIGTLSLDGVHIHISLATEEGHVIGGHLKEGCIIKTTAEIVIISFEKFSFSREFDTHTGYKELNIV